MGYHFLKLGVKPNSQSVKKGARVGDDWSCTEGRLVDFHKEVEFGDRILDRREVRFEVL